MATSLGGQLVSGVNYYLAALMLLSVSSLTADTVATFPAVAVVALVVLGLYVALASVRPLLVTRHRTGQWPVRYGRGIERLIGLLFPIAHAAVGVGVVADFTSWLSRITALDHVGVHIVGVVIAVAGLPLIVVAQETMGDSWRVGVDPAERTELVTVGVYARCRNPIYTAIAMMAAGVALLVPNPVSLAAVGLYVVAVELQVRVVEEPYLRKAPRGPVPRVGERRVAGSFRVSGEPARRARSSANRGFRAGPGDRSAMGWWRSERHRRNHIRSRGRAGSLAGLLGEQPLAAIAAAGR
jgi:protein-S-isoprenylcysteine O-methyltransferase Ste14